MDLKLFKKGKSKIIIAAYFEWSQNKFTLKFEIDYFIMRKIVVHN